MNAGSSEGLQLVGQRQQRALLHLRHVVGVEYRMGLGSLNGLKSWRKPMTLVSVSLAPKDSRFAVATGVVTAATSRRYAAASAPESWPLATASWMAWVVSAAGSAAMFG